MSFIPVSYDRYMPTILCTDGNISQRAIAVYILDSSEWTIESFKTTDRVVVKNNNDELQMCKVVCNLNNWTPDSNYSSQKSSNVFKKDNDEQRATIIFDLNSSSSTWQPTTNYTDKFSSTIFTDGNNYQRAEFVFNLDDFVGPVPVGIEYESAEYESTEYY